MLVLTLWSLISFTASADVSWIPKRSAVLHDPVDKDHPNKVWYETPSSVVSLAHFGTRAFPPPRCILNDTVKYYNLTGHTEIEAGNKVIKFNIIFSLASGKDKTTIWKLHEGYSEGRIIYYNASYNAADVNRFKGADTAEPENFLPLPIDQEDLDAILKTTFIIAPNIAVMSAPRKEDNHVIAKYLYPVLIDLFVAPQKLSELDHLRQGDEKIGSLVRSTGDFFPTPRNTLSTCEGKISLHNWKDEDDDVLMVYRDVQRGRCRECVCLSSLADSLAMTEIGIQSFFNAFYDVPKATIKNPEYRWNLAVYDERMYAYKEGTGEKCSKGILELGTVSRRTVFWPGMGGCFAKNGLCPHKPEPFFQEVLEMKPMTIFELKAFYKTVTGDIIP